MGYEPSLRGLQMAHRPKMGSYGKNWIFGPKAEILGPKKIHFLILSMFWPRPEKVVQRKEYPFWPINGQIWPNLCILGHFGPNIGIFGQFCPLPNQKTLRRRCLCGFSVMLIPKLLLSLVKIRIFCPKTTKFSPKLAFLVISGQV